MQDILRTSLGKIKQARKRKKRMLAVLLMLSLLVSLNVFWGLRRPGLAQAGDATCGIREHTHDEECFIEACVCTVSEEDHEHEDACYTRECICEQTEHVHRVECYSDASADVETLLDWQNMFAEYPYTGDLRQDLAGIARTQVGYTESTRNFEVDSEGNRYGYTRYGAWYGTPYRDWSAAFVSFCLAYAGADPAQAPGNIGANAMAEQWNNLGNYASAGEYVPVTGDLVFFADNTVGIVSEVMDTAFYVIRGDVDNAVGTALVMLNDPSVAGWGITAVSEEAPQQIQTYAGAVAQSDKLDLKEYLTGPDGTSGTGGSIKFELLDAGDQALTPDENGKYIVQAGTEYQIALVIYNPEGYEAKTYTYQIPNGLLLKSNSDTIYIDGVEMGEWEVSDSGWLELQFTNEEIKHVSEVTVTVVTNIQFPMQDDPIDFDVEVSVVVTPPPKQEKPTELLKGGLQGNEEDKKGKTDPSKLYWTIELRGHQDSRIPGSIVTDKVEEQDYYGVQRYTEADRAAGLSFSAISPDGGWHVWKVEAEDPLLEWSESGWTYKIPERVICDLCGELELGNDNWFYYINYTATPDPVGHAGALAYANHVTADNQSTYGWAEFQHGTVRGQIQKSGSFQADAGGGAFRWEIVAEIPGKQGNQKADFWYITDYIYLFGSDGNQKGVVTNDADRAVVTAAWNDTTVEVPLLEEAEDTDPFAWHVSWDHLDGNGVAYGRTMDILCNCVCTEENCPWWTSAGCDSRPWLDGGVRKNLCQCWNVEQDVTFTFLYETTDLSIIEDYGGMGNWLRNRAELNYKPQGNGQGFSVMDQFNDVTIPGLFKKELSPLIEDSIAHYTITVNEAKLSLTNGEQLYIRDEMSDTLAYISGSLIIRWEDANGNQGTLQQGTDYTVAYRTTNEDGTDIVVNNKKVHVLDIEILHPQPVKYVLDYDTAVIVPPGTTQAIKFTNSATITLWGKEITDSEGKSHVDFTVSAKTYRVDLSKTDAATGTQRLSDAMFGLFNEQGGEIARDKTDENGQLYFRTDISKGIIPREHVLYYLQELQAPPGYRLDDTKYWFCFCNTAADTCAQCADITEELTAVRIPYGKIEPIHITNEIQNYDLPATGGPGIVPLTLVSLLFITVPLVYGALIRRRGRRKNF